MSSSDAPAVKQGTFTGHPQGLYLLFFTEMWERFCYYGMRALLALYVAKQFTQGEQSGAALKYGAFTALVYATGIFGGAIADRLLGYQRAIILGGVFIALGEFALMVPEQNTFLMGLALMVVGNGLFKPNISSIVGKLYQQGDPRRDTGFTIFYMGINLGALLAPLVCDYVRDWGNASDPAGVAGFRYGFGVAGLCMLIGIVNFLFGRHRLGEHGKPPAGREGFGPMGAVLIGGLLAAGLLYFLLAYQEVLQWVLIALLVGVVIYILKVAFEHEVVQRERLFALLVLLFANLTFWAIFEQAGNSFNFFADNLVDRQMPIVGEFLTGWFQSVNPFFIVVLAPFFIWLWAALERRNANPSIPAKFGLALVQAGLGFLVIVLAARFGYQVIIEGSDAQTAKEKTAVWWLFLVYLLHTTGELCLSPIGLSMVTKLAPAQMVGFTMGAWFMSISIGNFLGGEISARIGSEGAKASELELTDYAGSFSPLGWAMVGLGVLLLLLSPRINRWMHGVK